jgi:hypothetical protein
VDTALGLVGFVVFVVCVIGLAASISWLVVKVSPKPKSEQARDTPVPPAT